jgi:hypothetical protein
MTYYVLKACLSHKRTPAKDIYSQLAETIADRKRILLEYQNRFQFKSRRVESDIHRQLAETLAERKRVFERLHRVLFAQKNDRLIIPSQKAA